AGCHRQHPGELTLKNFASSVLPCNLLRLDERITQDSNPECVLRLSCRPVLTTITPSIQPDEGVSFLNLPPFSASSQFPAAGGRVGKEHRPAQSQPTDRAFPYDEAQSDT